MSYTIDSLSTTGFVARDESVAAFCQRWLMARATWRHNGVAVWAVAGSWGEQEGCEGPEGGNFTEELAQLVAGSPVLIAGATWWSRQGPLSSRCGLPGERMEEITHEFDESLNGAQRAAQAEREQSALEARVAERLPTRMSIPVPTNLNWIQPPEPHTPEPSEAPEPQRAEDNQAEARASSVGLGEPF